MVACGNYINVFDDYKDIYVVLNEPNDSPTPEEVDEIERIVDSDYKDLEKAELNCLRYGYHVVDKLAPITSSDVESLHERMRSIRKERMELSYKEGYEEGMEFMYRILNADTISLSRDRMETLMKLCLAEGLSCGADKDFWESVNEKEVKEYISERVNSILEASGVTKKGVTNEKRL